MVSWNKFLYGPNWATRTDIPFETDGKTTYPNPNYKPETDKYLGHLNSDPRKGKNMNVQTQDNAGQVPAKINALSDLDGLTAAELEKLIAIKAVDEPVDGTIIGYVTVDVVDEADEDKTVQ